MSFVFRCCLCLILSLATVTVSAFGNDTGAVPAKPEVKKAEAKKAEVKKAGTKKSETKGAKKARKAKKTVSPEALPFSEKEGDYFNVRTATADSITVQIGVQTPAAEGTVVRLLRDDREIATATLKGRSARHRFDQLEPDAKYAVVAKLPAEEKKIECRTLPRPKGKPLLKLAVVSDTHVSIITEPAGRLHYKSVDILKDVCDRATRHKCAVMIVAGDITNANRPEEYTLAKQTLTGYDGALFMTPGNHDDTSPDAELWKSYFGTDASLELVGGIQFLRLNTANGKLNKPANIAAIDKLDPNVPAVVFSHMQLVPDDYLNDAGKVITDGVAVAPQLEKIGRSKAIVYIGHKNIATRAMLGHVEQINVPQTTQIPAGWLEVDIYPEGLVHRFVPSCSPALEELSRLLGGMRMKWIDNRDVHSLEIWNRFVPWPEPARVVPKKRNDSKLEKDAPKTHAV